MSTYILVHGAWHTGDQLQDVADTIRAKGHTVHTPTIAGNRPGDSKEIGLDEAVKSIVDYINENDLSDFVILGHSYGGMIISKVADTMPEKIRRLIYWNAFVPNDGECLNDLVPPMYVGMFEQISAEMGDGSVVLPYPVWREAFINDADAALAKSAFDSLNPHPYKTFTDKISLAKPLAELEIGKSYINCRQDTAMPHSLPWHPRLSERLGLFRLVEMDGSHESCFTNPTLLGEKIIEAGED
jgi:pimeloyl-ACP methyl ester carboxylesterase